MKYYIYVPAAVFWSLISLLLYAEVDISGESLFLSPSGLREILALYLAGYLEILGEE